MKKTIQPDRTSELDISNEGVKKSEERSTDVRGLHELDGKVISKMRSRKQWSRSEVAKRLGITRKKVAEYEQGMAVVTKEELFAICQLFDVTPSHVVYGSDAQSQARKIKAARKIETARKRKVNSPGLLAKKKIKRKRKEVKSIPWNRVLRTGFESSRRKH